MPRKPREISSTGIYHVVLKGHNRQGIFEDEEDNRKFIKALQDFKQVCSYNIYAYCLMGNHVHLLLQEGGETLEQIMRRLGGSYVYWYNWKYDRTGSLFQSRFNSEPVEDEAYFLTALRYIHQNPLQAGLVSKIYDYPWSSYKEYVHNPAFVDVDFALDMFHQEDRKKALQLFIEHQKKLKEDYCLEVEETGRLADREARDIIKKAYNVESPTELQNIEKHKRNACLKELKEDHQLSARQIARITGLGRSIVFRA